jgi:hypothetical protein
MNNIINIALTPGQVGRLRDMLGRETAYMTSLGVPQNTPGVLELLDIGLVLAEAVELERMLDSI